MEHGTGGGAVLCLESCYESNVWTINLLDGESCSDGTWAYGERVMDSSNSLHHITMGNFGSDELGSSNYHKTDVGDYIGRIFRERGLGNKVCQFLCDSRDWDNSDFSPDFFDSVLIDGGHQPDVVINDTCKALQVLRSGGLIMWHDFCSLKNIRSQFESMKGVTAGIEQIVGKLQEHLERLSWINPSWIFIGRENPRKF